eukprot:754379-Hanusia_phi.AAC.2
MQTSTSNTRPGADIVQNTRKMIDTLAFMIASVKTKFPILNEYWQAKGHLHPPLWIQEDGQCITFAELQPGFVHKYQQILFHLNKRSRGQYYEESNIQKNNEKIKRWNKRAGDVNEALQTLSLVSSKTAFTRKFEEFLEADMMYAAILWGYHCKRRCGRVRRSE